MAIRYSGDVETRMKHEGRGLYRVAVRSPDRRALIAVEHRTVFGSPDSPTTYDRVAKKAIAAVMEDTFLPIEIDGNGDILVRRVFQSPCPTDDEM